MDLAHATIVARLSPPGKSAIACLGVAGPRAWTAVRATFVRPNRTPLPETPAPRSIFVGSLGGDHVVLFVRHVEPTCRLEIDCHGGPEVVRHLESLFVAQGADVVSAQTWSHAIEGDERAEMLDVLARCPMPRTAAIALDQLHGAFDRATAEIATSLAANHRDEAARRLARLAQLVPLGERLVRPWKVVLAGAPNVGKSSLVNALAGFSRSIVHPTPGTTRDVVSTTIALDGWPVELLDTAGLRETGDELEAEGIARADAARAAADLVVWVLDATSPPEKLPAAGEFVVVNKIDRPAAWDALAVSLRVSARTNEGLDGLIASIVSRLIPLPPIPGEAVPIAAAHRERVARFQATPLQSSFGG